MSEWQDFATAPKDGTLIVAYGVGREDIVIQAEEAPFHALMYWVPRLQDRFEQVEDGLYRKAEPIDHGNWRIVGSAFIRPTHWMPLPDPPMPSTLKPDVLD